MPIPRLLLAAALAAAAVAVTPLAQGAQAEPAARTAPAALHVDPAGFVDDIDNPYFTLTPGTRFAYAGSAGGEAERNTVTVTQNTVEIMGVTCRSIVDIVSGADGTPIEHTVDWYAQDAAGNVWYFGEEAYDWVHGQWELSDGSWQAGVDGAQPGIVMLAHPQVGDTYQQEYYPGHAEDRARVIAFVPEVTVRAGTFYNVLETADWTPLEPGVVEYKYYAPGTGFIKSDSETEAEHFELVVVKS